MMIEIDLSNQAVKKIQALGALTGKSPKEISQLVAAMVEDRLNDIGGVVETALTGTPTHNTSGFIQHSATPARREVTRAPTNYQDTTGISDGLGEEDPYEGGVDAEQIAGETDPMALVPTSSSPSDEELTTVVPQNEEGGAGAEPTFSDDLLRKQSVEAPPAEQVFGDMLGVDVPHSAMGDALPDDHPRSKAQRKARARAKPRKGKVAPLLEEPT
jgi:hypothetical protein